MNGPIKTPSNPYEYSPTILPDDPVGSPAEAFTELTLSLRRPIAELSRLIEDVSRPGLVGTVEPLPAEDKECASPLARLHALSQSALSAKYAYVDAASQSSDPTIRLRFLGEIDFADPAFREAAVALLGDASRPVRTEAARQINRHLRTHNDDASLASSVVDLARVFDKIPDRLETICLALSGVASEPAEKILARLTHHSHPGVRNYAEMALRGP